MTVTHLPTRYTIGGSDAAAAAGIDPHKSRVMLWLEKKGRIERPETEAMRWGTLLQPVITTELFKRGWALESVALEGAWDNERLWCVGHPDHFGFHPDEHPLTAPRWVIEVKTVGQWAKREWNGDPPLAYVAQVQHYLHLTGLDRGLLAVLVGGQRLETYEIARSQSTIDKLLEREEEFYSFLIRDKPPPPDSSESAREAVAAMFPEHVPGRVMRLDGTQMRRLRELRARREQRETVETIITGLENAFKIDMGDAETAISPHDDPVLRWKTHAATRLAKGSVDSLREEWPQVYAQLATTTTTRKFEVL